MVMIMKILIADDHRYIVDDLQFELKQLLPNADITGTSDPKSIIKLLKENSLISCLLI